MQESGFSLNFRMLDGNGVEHQITFRAENMDGWGKVMTERAAFLDKATKAGWQPIALRQAPAPQAAAAAPKSASAPSPQIGGAQTFQATKLSVQFSPQGKKVGKLHGGHFQKFGVTVWPEVAEKLGFNLDQLDAGEYQCDLLVAYATNEEGKPQKVTGLAGAAEPAPQQRAASAGKGFSVEKGTGRVVSPAIDDESSIPF